MCENENISLRITMGGEKIYRNVKTVSTRLTQFSDFAIKRA